MRDNQIKIAVVGDVHDQWEDEDAEALRHLGVDLVLFVGDFGNESLEVVSKIASVDVPKAAVMGNHDAWFSATDWGRKKCPYDRRVEDRVQQQLDLLGEIHVGYSQLDFPQFQLSVVGGRPFTWGGPEWKCQEFFGDRYGVYNFTQSTAKIVAAVNQTSFNTIIFLGHNGPSGLGENPEDSCGKDWNPLGGDFGDPDLAEAIAEARQKGKHIPLVTFGHMHHRLRHTKERLRTMVNQDDHNTIYLNAASVPRIIELDGKKRRNFCLVSLENHQVMKTSLLWVGEEYQIISETKIDGFRPPMIATQPQY
jgi:uncharacterized protein (TIGR04168 family)